MVLLDQDQDAVLALIEDGHLAWAWDIRSREAERREVRIWRESLISHLAGHRQPDLDELTVIDSILPHFGPDIRSPQLQRLFTASQGHIGNLIDQGLIHGLNEATTGKNGFVRVSRDSIVNFLRRRRIV